MPYTLRNRRILVQSTARTKGTGWQPPPLDLRDYTPKTPAVQEITSVLDDQLKKRKSKALTAPPPSIDLRRWCSPIEDQGVIGSCTAHAALGIVEYFEKRAFSRHLDGSRLFVYKTTRNLMGVAGDTGAWLRNTMGALVTCGVPHEEYWEYTDAIPDFDAEPTQFVYAVADNYETTRYFSHDPLNTNIPPATVLASVKKFLAAGVPSMFGFFGYGSFESGDQPGHIPLPSDEELASDADWGHAVAAVGYDDDLRVKNTISGKTTKGALLIRNSWGTAWGQAGYGWFPYDYVLSGAALDFWSLLDMSYVETSQFFAS